MIPGFTENGLLPEGVHSASIEEFEERFVYFDRSDRRFRIFDNLRRLLQEAKNSGVVHRVIVGGSFVTAKAEPNDFDCIIVFDPTIWERTLRPMEYNVVSRKTASRRFGGDVFPIADGSIDFEEYLSFFQGTKDGQTVGVVEIEL